METPIPAVGRDLCQVQINSLHSMHCSEQSNQNKLSFNFLCFPHICNNSIWAEESYVDQEKLRCTSSMSWNSLIVECVWFLVGWLAWVGFWLMNNFFTKRETKTLCRESRVYYGSWKLNKTMCDWSVVRSGACFGQRWKPVCDTAPLFGLDWYPASVAATEIFFDTNSSFHTQFSRCCVPAWANCSKTCLFYLYL